MGEKIMGLIEDKYKNILNIALKLNKTSSILNPIDNTLTFARDNNYILKLKNYNKNLHVIVPYNINKDIIKNLSKNIHIYIIDKEDNIEYIFTYIHNLINKNKIPKKNIIGKNVYIHHSAIIGITGNTYCVCPDGSKLNLKHMGNVIIEDNVDIEAYTIVHRAGIDSTIIKEGSKICVKCNIGHNCIIGTHTFIAPGVLLGGGTKIGNNCYIWQGVITRSNIKICDNVIIGMGSLVMKDITKPGVYYGNPVRYVKSYNEKLR
jgi:acetyltransferase-like isoleucine patch superfamily enzyme